MEMTGTQHPLNEAMRSSIKCITVAIPFSPSLTMLFLIFVYYFVQGATIDASPNDPTHQQLLIRTRALSKYVEYYLELSYHDLLVYLGCCPS